MSKFIQYFSLSIPLAIGIFLPCFFGNEVTVASSRLSTSLFHSDWVHLDLEMKGLIKTFMENGKREMVIVAFGFRKIDLNVFMRLFHCAYVLFAFLKTLGK